MPERTFYVPIKEVIALARQGYNDATIIRTLKEQGYTPRQINDAFNQAKIKAAAGNVEEEMEPSIMTQQPEEEFTMPEPPAQVETPAPQGEEYYAAETGEGYGAESAEPSGEAAYPETVQYPAYESRPSTEIIEEVAEEIINEKWQDFKAKAGDFGMLRKYFEEKINSLALRTKKIENSIDKIHDAVGRRIAEYESELRTVAAELHALETAFSKILEPLVTSVRKIEQGASMSRETRAEAAKELTRLKRKEKEDDKLESRIFGKKRK